MFTCIRIAKWKKEKKIDGARFGAENVWENTNDFPKHISFFNGLEMMKLWFAKVKPLKS